MVWGPTLKGEFVRALEENCDIIYNVILIEIFIPSWFNSTHSWNGGVGYQYVQNFTFYMHFTIVICICKSGHLGIIKLRRKKG